MTKKIAITELKPKGFEKGDLEDLNKILNYIPVGASQTIYVDHKRNGTATAKEYKKISSTHVELVNSYEY